MLLLFFVTAILYSTVGLGGGSSYIALMILWSVPLSQIPIVALLCNISVVTINILRYKNRDFSLRAFLPLVATSIPMAYLGGRITLPTDVFILLLGSVLLLSGVGMFWGLWVKDKQHAPIRNLSIIEAATTGAILGCISGVVGIGGGIFLISILHWSRAGNNRQIAQITSGFIWCNSLAGLFGQFSKDTVNASTMDATLLSALIAVILGGLIGTQLHIDWLSPKQVKFVSALLICLVGTRLLIQL